MTDKPITLASLNVRGLKKNPAKPRQIKLWLASLPAPPQIILLQEHHLDGEGILATAKGLEYWQGASFWIEGISMGRSQRTSAGTAILVDKSIAPLITENGKLADGRAQFITIQSPDNGSLTILNVYAPRTSNERALLWSNINQAAPDSDHYILGGNFNHLEEAEQGISEGHRRMQRREVVAWHHLTLKLGLTDAWLTDSFRKLSKKAYTFDNGRSGTSSAISRIDKFMISQSLEERGGHIEVAISVRKFSDHSPLVITVWGRHSAPKAPTKYFDTTLLEGDKYREDMLEAWFGSPPPSNGRGWPAWVEAAVSRVTECNYRLAKEKKRAKGARIRTCSKKIQLAEVQLQRDPTNEEVRGILSDSQCKLAETFQASVERNRHLSSSTWLRYGDTCSNKFFDFHRVGRKKTLLRELVTDSGSITSQEDLSQFITESYAKLYASDAHLLETLEAQTECWSSVPKKVTSNMNEDLTREFTTKEVLEAIRALPKGKAPGHDGIPMEFFHELAEEVAPSLLSAFTEILNSGAASAYINKGTITLIPKTGDRTKLSNWRPITLLGSVYKILAKLLAGRIHSALTHVVRPNQTGFVPGRSILDNIFLA
jgi:exonuclease III